MKLLLDENVPFSFIKILKQEGYEVEHVKHNKYCRGKSDSVILEYAYKKEMTIISFDSDFCDFKRKNHFGIIKIEGKLDCKEKPLLELLKKYKNKSMKDLYFEINRKGAFVESKKYGKKRKFFFKQMAKMPIYLESLSN